MCQLVTIVFEIKHELEVFDGEPSTETFRVKATKETTIDSSSNGILVESIDEWGEPSENSQSNSDFKRRMNTLRHGFETMRQRNTPTMFDDSITLSRMSSPYNPRRSPTDDERTTSPWGTTSSYDDTESGYTLFYKCRILNKFDHNLGSTMALPLQSGPNLFQTYFQFDPAATG